MGGRQHGALQGGSKIIRHLKQCLCSLFLVWILLLYLGPQNDQSPARSSWMRIISDVQRSSVRLIQNDSDFAIISWGNNSSILDNTTFIVDTPACAIFELEPQDDPSLEKHFKGKGHPGCSPALVLLKNGRLKFNKTQEQYRSSACCYRTITRVDQSPDKFNRNADSEIRVSQSCIAIPKAGEISTDEFVQVDCSHDSNGKAKHFTEYFASVKTPSTHSVATKNKILYWQKYKESSNNRTFLPPNVLIIGIDSTSRLNSMRTMPKTRAFLLENDFIEMRGYTKVGYNTFPNIMAMSLGGFQKVPCYKQFGDANRCPFIWQQFSKVHYVTAFVEDLPGMAIFNLDKLGFVAPPADYYYRPFSLAYKRHLSQNKYCVGGLPVTSYMLNYVKEFSGVMGRIEIPYFMFSWFSAAGHDDLNGMKAADTDLLDLVSNVTQSPGFSGNNTIIILMADHGKNFGDFRETYQGYFEASLPLFFIRLPPSIKESQPHWYENLKENSNRLSSPLDLHATLEDILSLSALRISQKVNTTRSSFRYTHSNWNNSISRSAFSMFEATPLDRTCLTAGIPQKYCRCGISPYFQNDIFPKPRGYGLYLLDVINAILETEGVLQNKKCVPLEFKRYLYFRELRSSSGDSTDEHSFKQYLVAIETSPSGAHYEAVIQITSRDKIHIVGEINRINSYGRQSGCVKSNLNIVDFCLCTKLYKARLNKSRG